MIPQLSFITAFLRTRRLARQLKTRAGVAAYQRRKLARWRTWARQAFPAFRDGFGGPIDKAALMADFAAYNRAGMTADEAWAIFEGRAPQRPGLFVGASTGTSGNRGLYVISEVERHEWLGVLLAKTLPRFPLETAHVAIALPLNSALYRTANMPGLRARFFDLHDGMAQVVGDITAWGPDTVIAPPKVLRALAESVAPPRLRRVFSGAEVLDPLDRAVIEARFGVPVREIYMATEGLLGVACAHGTLHLCEDAVAFEWEDVPGSDLKAPVISDFVRTTQAMHRYRMNDLLLLGGPCRCGSPYQAISEIAGRADDVLTIGGSHTVTPDVLRNAIVDSDRRISDFRLRQTASDILALSVVPTEAAPAARDAVLAVLARQGVTARVDIDDAPLSVSARKLRRIERVWRG